MLYRGAARRRLVDLAKDVGAARRSSDRHHGLDVQHHWCARLLPCTNSDSGVAGSHLFKAENYCFARLLRSFGCMVPNSKSSRSFQ